jgi:hypothetical protein
MVNGSEWWANSHASSIPTALRSVVAGVVSLYNLRRAGVAEGVIMKIGGRRIGEQDVFSSAMQSCLSQTSQRLLEGLVPGGGVEPPRPEGRQILSPTHSFIKEPIFYTLQRLERIRVSGPVQFSQVS